jgi:DNA-directed RNA polymerase subunit L
MPHPSEKKVNIRVQTNGALAITAAHVCYSSLIQYAFCLQTVLNLTTCCSGDITATEALTIALERLQQLSDVLLEQFQAKMVAHRTDKGQTSIARTKLSAYWR